MGMIVNSIAYEAGRRIGHVDLERPGDPEPGENRFVWIGLDEPDQALLRTVQLRFGLHDLAVEDALVAHQRPKLEIYGDSLFIVLRTAHLKDQKVCYGETHIFAGKGYVVTVRHGSTIAYTDVRLRCESVPKMLSLGESFVVYSIMDFVVDRYFPVIHGLETEVDTLEEIVFARRSGRQEIERIYELRHELMLLRRTVQPLEEVCARIMRFDAPVADDSVRPYFRDVQDHVIRVVESIDNLRDLVGAALEANLLLSSAQQNEVTKRLAGWAAILAVPTAIAGIYGMNFKWMPELEQPWGYPAVMSFMVGLCGYIYYRLRRAGWI